MARASGRGSGAVSWETVRACALTLPATEEGTSYGTPAFRVRGKLFVRLHDSGDSLVVRMEPAERTMRMAADPESFHITDHYLNYPWVLVRLAVLRRDDLKELLADAWRCVAPKRLLAEFDG
jgi:hypothetical protein